VWLWNRVAAKDSCVSSTSKNENTPTNFGKGGLFCGPDNQEPSELILNQWINFVNCFYKPTAFWKPANQDKTHSSKVASVSDQPAVAPSHRARTGAVRSHVHPWKAADSWTPCFLQQTTKMTHVNSAVWPMQKQCAWAELPFIYFTLIINKFTFVFLIQMLSDGLIVLCCWAYCRITLYICISTYLCISYM